MDPLCHTLVGAALGNTGLERATAWSRTTLIAAANLPDIDVLAHFASENASYGIRRGITHGIPALIVLPFLLAGLVYLIASWQRRLAGTTATAPPLNVRALLLLASVGVWSHPALDWLNTYGMRWLMPLRNEWFYGDALFIMDWVMWSVLIVGLLLARRAGAASRTAMARPASLALIAVLAYSVANLGITYVAESRARSVLADTLPERILASPVPFNPLARELVIEYPEHYATGRYAAWPGDGFTLSDRRVARGDPAHLDLARSTRDGRWFVHWVRFPYSFETRDGNVRRITIADARYVPDIDEQRLDGFAVFEFEVTD